MKRETRKQVSGGANSKEDSDERLGLHATQMVALPFRHSVDRPALLFQPRADTIFCRNRSRRPQRRDSETGAAGALVVPMGRNGYGNFWLAVFADVVGDATGLRDGVVDGRNLHWRPARTNHVGQRLVRHLAESENS